MKITVTQRQVLRFETIQTPAGTYHCAVIRETKLEKGMGRNRHTIADTWYSKGVGMVRHDTYNLELELQTSEILTGIHLAKTTAHPITATSHHTAPLLLHP